MIRNIKEFSFIDMIAKADIHIIQYSYSSFVSVPIAHNNLPPRNAEEASYGKIC